MGRRPDHMPDPPQVTVAKQLTEWRRVLVAVAAILAAHEALAADAPGPADWFREHGKGKLEYKLFWYSKDRGQDSYRQRSEYRLDLELDIPLSERLRLLLAPELRWDTEHLHAGTFDEGNREEARRPIFHFREAYLEWQNGPWEAALGERIFAWGTADGYNPTDNLNPRDYLDAPDDSKIPVLALSTAYYPTESASLQFVVLPVFTPTRFQVDEGRWAFFPGKLPVDLDRDLPSDTFTNAQYALRAKTTVQGWDLSVSYFDGYNDVARPSLLLDRLGRPELVRLHYDKIRVVGADFATTWGKVGLHGEFAHTTTDSGRDEDYIQYVVGLDYTWADVRPGQNLRLIL